MLIPKKFDVIVAAFISLVNSVILSILLPFIAVGYIKWEIFLKGFAISYVISLLLSLVIPAVHWGEQLAVACKTKPFSLCWRMISTIMPTLVFATMMSLCMVAVNVGIGPYTITAWLAVYPYALITIYVSSLIATPISVTIAKRLCGVPTKTPSV